MPGSHNDGMETGHDVELVGGEVAENLLCSSCKDVLRQPIQSSCGHRFCTNCFTALFRDSGTPSCPVDDISIVKDASFHDVFAEREVQSLVVQCPSRKLHSGCSWTGELRTLKDHEDVCEFLPRPCPNGCDSLVSRTQLAQHAHHDCSARLVSCKHCQKEVRFKLMDKHKETCTEAPTFCPNGCTLQAIPRSQMAEHLQVCPKQKVKCFYSPMGCDFEGARCDLPAHHETSLAYHLQICYNQAHHNQETINFLIKQNSMLAEKCASLEDGFVRLQATVERRMMNLASQRTPSPQSEETVRGVQNEQELAVLRDTTSAQEQRLISVERSLALHDIQLSEMDIRQNLQETKMSNGVLVWKISEFRRRQQEAISGKTPSLYSPPFYTSPAGYKVCARLYPNGDGVGRGTHLSFFFVVMKGEFDALLPWPFHQKVSLMLLDQHRSNPRDIVETFRPDPSSSSFQRPKQDTNIASGCPLFVPLSALNESSYLHDNALYLKVVIHPQGLQAPDEV